MQARKSEGSVKSRAEIGQQAGPFSAVKMASRKHSNNKLGDDPRDTSALSDDGLN
jgi:hypothetical protein